LLLNVSTTCSTLPGCHLSWQHCEIVRNLPEDQFYENFNNPHFNWIVTTTLGMQQNCQREGTTNLAAIGPATSKCVECLLVYDLVKFFDETVIGVQTERAVLMAVAEFCNGLGGSLMMSFCNDALQILDAVFQGLRDSMGGLYELFGTNLLGCPRLPEFMCNCLGQMCS
uniref:Saposin B-type domain-containing protein n=1 Tax=Anisakis simplex TaxID=6269 RepID=A0A0M3JV74_ANISI